MTTEITSNKIEKLQSLIASADIISVITHARPDGDAIGSCIGISRVLSDIFHKKIHWVINDRWPDYLDFIIDKKDSESSVIYEENASDAETVLLQSDLVFCMDFNSTGRVEGLEDALNGSQARKILIDHHPCPSIPGLALSFSEPQISSASELCFWIIMNLDSIGNCADRIPEHSRYALMSGMTTDTNNFSNSVFPSTFEMASKLLSTGLDRDRVIENLFNRFRENRIRMQGYALKDKLTITPEGGAYIVLTEEDLKDYDIQEGELEGLVNIPLAIKRVKMSILAKEHPGCYRISIRSRKPYSSRLIAGEHFNGGGHEQASGGKIPMDDSRKTAEDVASIIEDAFKQYLSND